MKEIQIERWSDFKEICIRNKKLNIQCTELSRTESFHIFAVEDNIYWFVNIMTDEDIKDFKKNYWKTLNKRIKK